MKEIVLVAINSRYTHTSIALKYLYANLNELQKKTEIIEFVINEQVQTIAEKILEKKPKIIGIGVYIWNAIDVHNLIEVLKKVSPKTKIVLGGPEVSHQPFRVNFDKADFIVQGEGEISFYELCLDILKNRDNPKIIKAKMPNLKELKLPYSHYSEQDIRHRYIYVEASRGCPFECEFCLSAIDEKVRHFDIDILLDEFETLWQKGARNFKFIDRTFNLNIHHANSLMDFFLAKDELYSLHFEVIPDHFPEALKEKILKFPPKTLQLEIGIQTLNSTVLKNINRKMNLNRVKKNIDFLENSSKAHLHLDLIVGLPGETLESFAKNLNRLKMMTNSEIQIGILKKLSGTTLSRHDEKFGFIYSDKPPYDILQNDNLSFETIQKMKRFARFWDLTYNSGNFQKTLEFIFEKEDVFKSFYEFSEWIYKKSESTWQISLNRLSEYIFIYLTEYKDFNKTKIADTILSDLTKVNGRKIPKFLQNHISFIPDIRRKNVTKHNKRQLLRE